MKDINQQTNQYTSVIAALLMAAIMGLPGLVFAAEEVSPIEWQSCGPDYPAAECAAYEVPLDHDQPFGDQISLALARVAAPNPDQKVGTIFVNPGGPGGSGVGMVLRGFGESLVYLTGGQFDVIGFDPRGIGGSTPIQCFDTNEERDAFFGNVPIFPYLKEQKRPFFEVYDQFAERCLDRDQAIVHHMSTADVVRDLDLLRQAVGDAGLTYLGFSYGSFIGNTYANLFPDNVRALVIDGVLNPWLWSWSMQIVSDRTATQEVFEEFLRLCDEAGPDCAFSSPEGAKTRFETLAELLQDEPLVFPDGSIYSYDYLIADAASAMYNPSYWGGPDGYAALFDYLAHAVIGDRAAALAARDLAARLMQR